MSAANLIAERLRLEHTDDELWWKPDTHVRIKEAAQVLLDAGVDSVAVEDALDSVILAVRQEYGD